jgi:hypothetical protein
MRTSRFSRMVRSIVGLSLISVGLGCGSPGGPDGAVTIDSGIPEDAGGMDAGGFDAGGFDAGGFDAGQFDAGGSDAGQFDAGGPDAGLSDGGFDGGAPDAGVDAGPSVGCSSGSQCASGICLGTGCFNCQSDAECGTGERCGTGVCAASCVNATTCAPGQDCCGGRCVDPRRDPSHCGQCGQACAANQFCGSATCRPADFSQLCQLPLATVMLDEIAEDDDAGLSMGSALVSACAPALTLRTAGQTDAGVLRIADGEPLALGELLVIGGGSFRQDAVAWLETTNTALLRDTSTTADAIYSLRDGGVASTVPFATLGPTRDRGLVQLVRTPSGSVVLNAAGFFGPGTLAASWYFVQNILPMRASLTTSWYVIEWEDLDATGGPTAADRYTLIASGS